MRWSLALLTVVAVVACQQPPPPEQPPAEPAGPAPGTPEWKIQNAMSAAPTTVAQTARIMDWPASEGAQPTELRAGTSDWTCFPDQPDIPGNDPMCLDKTWLAWADAWMNRKPFSTSVAGIGYMLQGGCAASATDPYKAQPDTGQDWLCDPPHLMWISPNAAQLAQLPTDPASGGPWVMWKGTPYVHVMIPVR